MGRVSYGRSGTGRGTPLEVRDGSGDSRGGPGRVGGPSSRCWTGHGTLGEVMDGSSILGGVQDW